MLLVKRWPFFAIFAAWGLVFGFSLFWRNLHQVFESAQLINMAASMIWFLIFCILGAIIESIRVLWRRFKRHIW